MTKSEYFEKNNVSFAKALKAFNEQKKFTSFDKFLNSEYSESKFKVGDLIVLQLNEDTQFNGWMNNIVFEIIGIDEVEDEYEVKFLTPSNLYYINDTRKFTVGFIDRNCVLY